MSLDGEVEILIEFVREISRQLSVMTSQCSALSWEGYLFLPEELVYLLSLVCNTTANVIR